MTGSPNVRLGLAHDSVVRHAQPIARVMRSRASAYIGNHAEQEVRRLAARASEDPNLHQLEARLHVAQPRLVKSRLASSRRPETPNRSLIGT